MTRLTDEHLTNHQRTTVEKLLRHPTSGNVEWRQVVSMLRAIGTVTEEHNGNLKVTIGPETEVLHPPRGKDIDRQMVSDLRRMLEQAGLAPGGPPAVGDQRTRDHGDGRWGEPTE
jgi:hypothetical protein